MNISQLTLLVIFSTLITVNSGYHLKPSANRYRRLLKRNLLTPEFELMNPHLRLVYGNDLEDTLSSFQTFGKSTGVDHHSSIPVGKRNDGWNGMKLGWNTVGLPSNAILYSL